MNALHCIKLLNDTGYDDYDEKAVDLCDFGFSNFEIRDHPFCFFVI